MKAQIWQFPIPGDRDFFLAIPTGAKFLSVGTKDGQARMYFSVPDIDAPKSDYMFFVVGTGWDLRPEEENGVYLGSFVVNHEVMTMVFHVIAEKTGKTV